MPELGLYMSSHVFTNLALSRLMLAPILTIASLVAHSSRRRQGHRPETR
jgi:hypothetical protein